ncbi:MULTISPECIES: succinylglutamate desuccinylase/aspartoacylase family protein [Cysteiniphilum]|uniref:M14 family zinc carboxypeptidase n=2 Tax=Fastidiosibacteraceae TaxID=2056687 RepID=UPI00193A1F44|nr:MULTISPECIES: succinylglutamate desuccinylase/aspartoacylase family protein [Cysteiniphilum]
MREMKETKEAKEMKSYITKSLIDVGQNASGEAITVAKYKIKGQDQNAKKVYIQASMHASEIQGNAVIINLLKHFNEEQPQGDITIIPQCNPFGRDILIGAGHQGRFDATNGDNWNRYYFKPEIDYQSFAKEHLKSAQAEYATALRNEISAQMTAALNNDFGLSRARRLNYTMQLEALQADIILDLHTDSLAIDYLYSPQYAKDSAESLGFEYVLLIENKCNGSLDEAGFYPWWSVQKAFTELGRNEPVLVDSFTLELGSEELIDHKKAQIQSNRILNYLAAQQVIAANKAYKEACAKHIAFYDEDSFQAVYAQSGGLYEWFVVPGDTFDAGQVIGRCLQMVHAKECDVSFSFAGLVISVHSKGALQRGSHLLNVIVSEL